MDLKHTILYRRLHGSVNEFYRDLPGSDMPPKWQQVCPKAVHNILSYQGTDALRNHSLLHVRYDDQDMALMAMCAQKLNSPSQSYYAQSYLMELTPRMLLEQFDELLGLGYHSEKSFNLAAEGAAPQDYHWSDGGLQLTIAPDVLRAVLYGMVNVWYTAAPPVVIAVPEGADYERYTHCAVRQIYSHLPAALRLLAGFMTYAEPDRKISSVALYFLPASKNHSGAVCLDGSTNSFQAYLNNTLPAETKAMLDELVSMSAEDRKAALWRLACNVESSANGPDGEPKFGDLSELYCSNYTNFWNLRDLETLDMDNADDFEYLRSLAADPSAVPNAQRDQLPGIVQSKVKNKHLDHHFLNSAKSAADPEGFYQILRPWLPLCALGKTNRKGQNLETHIWNTFWTFCGGLAKAQQSEAALTALHGRVIEVIRTKIREEGNDDQVEILPEEPYASIYSDKLTEFNLAALSEQEKQLLADIRAKCSVRGQDPNQTYQELVENFQNALPESLRDNKALTEPSLVKAENALQEAAQLYEKAVRDWFFGPIPADPSQDQLSLLIRTANGRKSSSDYYLIPKPLRDSLLRQLEGYEDTLHQITIRSFDYISDVRRDAANNNESYFARLEKLCGQLTQGKLTVSDHWNIYETDLIPSRPLDTHSYMEEYKNHFRRLLSIPAFDAQEEALRKCMLQDLQALVQKSRTIDLKGCSLSELSEIVATHVTVQALLGAQSNILILRFAKETLSINGEALAGVLTGFLGRRFYTQTLPQDCLEKLIRLLYWSKTLSTEDLPNVLTYLRHNPDSNNDLYTNVQKLYLSVPLYRMTYPEYVRRRDSQSGLSMPQKRTMAELYREIGTRCQRLYATGNLNPDAHVFLEYIADNKPVSESYPLEKLLHTLTFYLAESAAYQGCRLDYNAQASLCATLVQLATNSELITMTAAISQECKDAGYLQGLSSAQLKKKGEACIAAFFSRQDISDRERLMMYDVISKFGSILYDFFDKLTKKHQWEAYKLEYGKACWVFSGNDPANSSHFNAGGGFRAHWRKLTSFLRKKDPAESAPETESPAPENPSETPPETPPEIPGKAKAHWKVPAAIGVSALLLAGVLLSFWLTLGEPKDDPHPTDPTNPKAPISSGQKTEPIPPVKPDWDMFCTLLDP